MPQPPEPATLYPEELEHTHPELPAGHPHTATGTGPGGRHVHAFRIDALHRHWPGRTGPAATG
ncbi:hypothetical protein [Streptomyces filamentosus]|uniref:hypothetical protein n=1 Tax=Streptomyces filamentosus TaxID=67294 RepID=UPI00332F77E1